MQQGIDTSHWSGEIDWPTVKASGLVEFVINKATEGTAWVDNQFYNNKNGCNLVGLPNGAYHFFRPNYDPVLQANHFVATCGDNIKIYACDVETAILSAAYDDLVSASLATGSEVESWSLMGKATYSDAEKLAIQKAIQTLENTSFASASGSGVQISTLAELVKSFMERVHTLTGQMGVIYTSPGFWDAYVHRDWIWDMPYDLWVAHWTNLPQPQLPLTWTEWVLWQYTASLRIPGIPSAEDGDWAKDALNLFEYFGNGVPEVETVTIRVNNSYRRALTIYKRPNLQSPSLGLAFASSEWEVEPKIMGEDNREYYKLGYSGYIPAILCTEI